MFKHLFYFFAILLLTQNIVACSTNPATGERQFAALMSPAQEIKVGTQEHKKIMKQYGLYNDKELQNYVSLVGSKVVKKTERPDVSYKFFLLDSPIVNAFALPGGYIYITRGLLALANSEAEMASVLAHEAGHITARHSAERYSRGVVTSLGAMILSSAVGSDGAAQALGLGSNLYMKSYSRGQESQADSLGIRYLSRSGYDPKAMAYFLRNLQADGELTAKIEGKSSSGVSYFSTHPDTAERVSKSIAEARQYPRNSLINHDGYLHKISGMIYGDSPEQGFVRGNNFYHSELGFKFSVPNGYKIINQPSQIIATSKNGGVIVFDLVANKDNLPPSVFLRDKWMQGKSISRVENVKINGMNGASATLNGSVNGKNRQIQLVAIAWKNDTIARFQIAMPPNMSQSDLIALKRATYSFDKMSAAEKRSIKPYRIKIIAAKTGDSVASLSRYMAMSDYKEQRFRVLNGLSKSDEVVANNLYKIVVE